MSSGQQIGFYPKHNQPQHHHHNHHHNHQLHQQQHQQQQSQFQQPSSLQAHSQHQQQLARHGNSSTSSSGHGSFYTNTSSSSSSSSIHSTSYAPIDWTRPPSPPLRQAPPSGSKRDHDLALALYFGEEPAAQSSKGGNAHSKVGGNRSNSGFNYQATDPLNLNRNNDQQQVDDASASRKQSRTATTFTPKARVSPFSSDWTCTADYIRNGTPSRLEGISYSQELGLRIRGTNFIRQVVSSLKLKNICKETAYIYFHRYFMLRSFKTNDPCRIGLACVYLASKYEDHPAFKEHMVRIYQLLTTRKDLTKSDKDYAENCDRLIRDENQILQVLGFESLGISHFQVLIVESSMQTPITNFSKAMYSNAYKIATEINRLTMLCVEYPSHILACVAIYLASVYHGIVLLLGWTSRVKGATAEDMPLVMKLGDEIKERIARESDLVKTLLSDNKVIFPAPKQQMPSPQTAHFQQQQQQLQQRLPNVSSANMSANASANSSAYNSFGSRGSSNSLTMSIPGGQLKRSGGPSGGSSGDISQQIMSTFSPDSAYSSNSSHSPPEKKRKKHSYSNNNNNHNHYHQHNNVNVSNTSLHISYRK